MNDQTTQEGRKAVSLSLVCSGTLAYLFAGVGHFWDLPLVQSIFAPVELVVHDILPNSARVSVWVGVSLYHHAHG